MANFRTHLGVAAVASGLVATVCLGAGLARPEQIVLLAATGTIGGILPDIDLDHATPTKIMFTALGLIFAFTVMLSKADEYSILELWLSWGFSYAIVRYLAWQVFSDLTIHRGIFHSVVAAMFFWFFTTALCYHLFDADRLLSWVTGFFIFMGYIIHLSLDELYSVDFMDRRLKRSFGTAIKLFDYKNYTSSVLMTGAAVLMWLMTPDSSKFTDMLFSTQTYSNIADHFLPRGMWFSF